MPNQTYIECPACNAQIDRLLFVREVEDEYLIDLKDGKLHLSHNDQYDLDTIAERCPECGTSIDISDYEIIFS